MEIRRTFLNRLTNDKVPKGGRRSERPAWRWLSRFKPVGRFSRQIRRVTIPRGDDEGSARKVVLNMLPRKASMGVRRTSVP